MSTITPGTEESIETNWRPLAVAGGLIAVLGLIAAALPFGTGIALAYVLGAALLVGGVVHAGHAFTTDGWAGSLWQAALAGITIVAGLLILGNPLIGLASLTLLAIAYLLVDGLAELVASLRMGSGSGRGWVAASGVLSLVLAGLPVGRVPRRRCLGRRRACGREPVRDRGLDDRRRVRYPQDGETRPRAGREISRRVKPCSFATVDVQWDPTLVVPQTPRPNASPRIPIPNAYNGIT
ncbi:hypothetical protein C479_04137 [Halovivax asiaticus JCM 14624]|uniref:DUF308 domain-containing protein n=1 Tax=Halovivax asiaticus JCM 14624 TaxID=1227490 RepID=M0BSA6_9EURY|nr:hypothetical protein C479_04137 [Halovivax asiaticus JCM 14624]